MKYKTIVLDLDGTLTTSEKVITPRTKSALMEAQRAGIRIVLASGRPTYGISPIANELKIGSYGGFVMAYNGGRITDWSSKEIVFDQPLAPELVPDLYAAAMESGTEILTYQGEGIAATNPNDEYVKHEAFINKMPIQLYNDFIHQVEHPINKCLIVGKPQLVAELEKQLSAKLAGKCSIYRSTDFFLECVPQGIDKAASLDWLKERMGIDRDEIVAMGDGYNDISMIEYAGLGVAMANATQEVKEKADFVTLSNEEDGVAYVIEEVLNIKCKDRKESDDK